MNRSDGVETSQIAPCGHATDTPRHLFPPSPTCLERIRVCTPPLHHRRHSLFPKAMMLRPSDPDRADANGASPTAGGDEGEGAFVPLSPPADPEALPRLGWYLYLLTKDVLGFRSSNVAFVRCLNLVLAALGAVVWNSSICCLPFPPSEDGSYATGAKKTGVGDAVSTPLTGAAASEGAAGAAAGVVTGGVAAGAKNRVSTPGGEGGSYGGEAALLAALSESGRCPASDVRAMSEQVVGVMEALLDEGILVSHHWAYSSPTAAAPGGKAKAPAAESPQASAESTSGGGSNDANMPGDALAEGRPASATPTVGGRGNTESVELADPRAVSAGRESGAGVGSKNVPGKGARAEESSSPLAGRAERVAGVFHPAVAAENAARLDACYWARLSQRGDSGGVGLLDETFVLTPSLR